MARISIKRNQSSMQVLKTLKVLLQGNYTMQELIEILNSGEVVPIFNNSVISKYINTCRYCQIDIPKIHNRYFVASMPFGLELTGSDINLLEILQNVIRQEMTSKCNKLFDCFIEKLNRFSNKKIARVEKETYQVSAELFDLAVNEKRKIRLMFKNRNIVDGIPLEMVENKGKTYFHIITDRNKDKMIDASRVSGIEVLSEKYIQNYNGQVVVFELKGALAQKYNLRENERLLKKFDGKSITVSNHGENKDILLARLMRYDDKCEILNPKSYRDDMVRIIEESLSNYGEN